MSRFLNSVFPLLINNHVNFQKENELDFVSVLNVVREQIEPNCSDHQDFKKFIFDS